MLEQAVQLSPGDASLWSDLSAAYHARAERRGDPVDLLPAFRAARRAVDLKAGLPEARFNLALSYEKLFLPQARRAWGDYLKLDQDEPAWAREGAEHFFRLAAPSAASDWEAARPLLLEAAARGDQATVRDLAGRFPERVRDLAERELLGEWADLRSDDQEERGSRALRILGTIGLALADQGEDPFLEETVQAIQGASTQPGKLKLLRSAHHAFQTGLELRSSWRLKEAADRFREARTGFRAAGSPFALLADLSLATSLHQLRDGDSALQVLKGLIESTDLWRYPSVQGRVYWLWGLSLGARGDATGCLNAYGDALGHFERTGEHERSAALQTRLAEQLRLLGDHTGAWKALYQALAFTTESTPGQLGALWNEAAEDAVKLGFPEAALAFQDQAVRQAETSSDPVVLAYGLLQRSVLRFQLGQAEAARADLAAARQTSKKVSDSSFLRRIDTDLARTEAVVAQDPRRAVELVTEVLANQGDLGQGAMLAPLYRTRARAWLALRNDSDAEADFDSALRVIERQRGNLEQPELRISFLDDSENVYAEMIRLQLRKGEFGRAFDYAERARSRALLDSLGALALAAEVVQSRAVPLSLEEIQRSLPRGVALIEFSVLGDQVAVWGVTRDRLVSRVLALRESLLLSWVERFRAVVRGKGDRQAVTEASASLFNVLMRDVLNGLPKEDLLVLIPDGPLERLPFAALVDPRTGHFLLEDRVIGFAPSATLYLRMLERDRDLVRKSRPGLLVVGDPAFDPLAFPGLTRLSNADREADRIAALYPAVTLLTGREASKERFLTEAGRSTLVHYAGHTLVNPVAPALSCLVLAGRGRSAALYAQEIQGAVFGKTRMVVLASCDTAAGASSRSEGVISLARSFLSAGVPTVVATSWQIEDKAAAHLFPIFHQKLREGQPVMTALRSAQLELLRDPDPALQLPANWAGVQGIGASLNQ